MNKIKKVTINDNNYPKALNILKKQAPKEIYYLGNLDVLNKKSIAIVGSRRHTKYGRDVADKFVSDFVVNDVATVSGFMYGIDTIVHEKTIEYGGQTVAVLGCGLNVIYPPENKELFEKIIQTGGLILSEYESDSKPHLWKFPKRNRIVAALSNLGTLVIEASEKSGSLITAKLTKKIKKPIFCIPGSITSSASSGTNLIIKEGWAQLVTNSNDILKINHLDNNQSNQINYSVEEKTIVTLLKLEPLFADEIAAQSEFDITKVLTLLTTMSIKGYIYETGGKYYLK